MGRVGATPDLGPRRRHIFSPTSPIYPVHYRSRSTSLRWAEQNVGAISAALALEKPFDGDATNCDLSAPAPERCELACVGPRSISPWAADDRASRSWRDSTAGRSEMELDTDEAPEDGHFLPGHVPVLAFAREHQLTVVRRPRCAAGRHAHPVDRGVPFDGDRNY